MGGPRISKGALALELGVSPATIFSDGVEAGVASRGGGYTPAEAEAIRAARRARRARLLVRDLAAELGVCDKTIEAHARRVGAAWRVGYTPEEAAAIRASVAASPRLARRGRPGAG